MPVYFCWLNCEPAGVDEAHEQIADLSAVQRLIEQRILPVKHSPLQCEAAQDVRCQIRNLNPGQYQESRAVSDEPNVPPPASEDLDLTTPTVRAMAGLLSVFAAFEHEIIREPIRAGIAGARLKGKHPGRPVTVGKQAGQIRKLYRAGVSKAEITRRLEIGRTSVRRIFMEGKTNE